MNNSHIYDGDGERLDVLIAQYSPEHSRAQIKRAIESGLVLVNQKACTKAGKKLNAGDEISWDLPEIVDTSNPQSETGIEFGVIFEDDHLIVIDKPSGLVVHPGAGNLTGTLVNGLLERWPQIAQVGDPERPGIVHRLDGETSGLLLVAKTQEAYEKLVPMFAEHEVRRQYWAICSAPKLPDSGRFDTPYGRHPTQRVKYTSRFDAPKRAITDYRVLDRNDRGFTLVTCLLHTGRTHQVRVHLSEHNAPILGDSLYSPQAVFKNKYIQRLALHAGKLAFLHPITGAPCEFVSPFPDDFQAALHALKLKTPEA